MFAKTSCVFTHLKNRMYRCSLRRSSAGVTDAPSTKKSSIILNEQTFYSVNYSFGLGFNWSVPIDCCTWRSRPDTARPSHSNGRHDGRICRSHGEFHRTWKNASKTRQLSMSWSSACIGWYAIEDSSPECTLFQWSMRSINYSGMKIHIWKWKFSINTEKSRQEIEKSRKFKLKLTYDRQQNADSSFSSVLNICSELRRNCSFPIHAASRRFAHQRRTCHCLFCRKCYYLVIIRWWWKVHLLCS